MQDLSLQGRNFLWGIVFYFISVKTEGIKNVPNVDSSMFESIKGMIIGTKLSKQGVFYGYIHSKTEKNKLIQNLETVPVKNDILIKGEKTI